MFIFLGSPPRADFNNVDTYLGSKINNLRATDFRNYTFTIDWAALI